MKTLIAIIGFIGVLAGVASWLDLHSGDDAESVAFVGVISFCLLALDAGLIVLYALYRLFFT